MGHRTGTYFQMARGRAMVRTRAMRRAWSIKRAIESIQAGQRSPAMRILGPTSWGHPDGTVIAILRGHLDAAVIRARRANSDWRRYRATSVDLGEIDRAKVTR
jgi:hypothetical protein